MREPAPPAGANDVATTSGRVAGRRGRATRERLLRCTAELLEKTSYRDLTVIDIAECAGTSPATFYQYFPDVEAAVVELAGALADEAEALTELIRASEWDARSGAESALRLVDAFLDLWERHRPVLRVVDLSTAEGDMRFGNVRTHLLNDATTALRDVIERSTRRGRQPTEVDPLAQAAVLVSMLAHVSAHRYGYEFWGIRTEDVRQSAAQLLYAGVTGRR